MAYTITIEPRQETITIEPRTATITCEVDEMNRLSVVPDQVMSLGGGLRSFSPASKYTWYVDSVTGSDSNAGTSPNVPFLTIAKLMTVLQAGQSVGLARGGTWREQLSLSVANVTVAAYGVGADPILDCADVAANASWSKTAGRTNIYQITLATNYTASEPTFRRVWEDGTRLPLVADLATCDTTPGSYYVATHDAASVTWYVHATGSTNVTSNGRTYEVNVRNSGLYSWSVSGAAISGIAAKRNAANNGSIVLGASSTATDCTVTDGSKHHFYGRRGCNFTRCTASDAYYGTNTSTAFVINDDTPAGEHSTLDTCTVTMPTYSELMTAFYGHHNVSGNFGTLTIKDCTVTNCFAGVSAQHFDHTVVTNLTLNEVRYALNYSDSANVAVSGMTHTASAAIQARTLNNSAVITLTIDSLTATIADAQTAVIYSSVASDITITNSTIATTKAATSNQTHINLTSASAHYTASNNAHRAPNVASGPYIYFIAAGATIASNNNRFDKSASWFNVGGANYGSLAAYQAGSGLDAASVVG